MDKAQVTRAPFPLTLGTNSIEMHALSDAAVGELDQWVRAEYISRVDQATRLMPDGARKDLLRIAFGHFFALRAFDSDGRKLLATPLGLAKLVLVSSQCKVPINELEALLLDPANIDLINEAFAYLNPRPQGNVARRTQGPALPKKKSTQKSS